MSVFLLIFIVTTIFNAAHIVFKHWFETTTNYYLINHEGVEARSKVHTKKWPAALSPALNCASVLLYYYIE